MSWGFFLDLELTLATAEWTKLQAITGSALPAGWWGFEESELDERFAGASSFDAMAFKKAFGFWRDGKSARKRVTDDGVRTTVQLTAHLDRSGDTQVAKPIAALFDAAARVGATGHLRLVNDGSYSGESGVAIRIAKGKLTRERFDDVGDLTEELGAAIYPDMEAIIAQYTSAEANAHHAATKSAKKAVATKSAKKAVATKSVKKVATKSAKKAVAKKR